MFDLELPLHFTPPSRSTDTLEYAENDDLRSRIIAVFLNGVVLNDVFVSMTSQNLRAKLPTKIDKTDHINGFGRDKLCDSHDAW